MLRAAHGSRRIHLTDDQRRRLAVKGKVLGRRGLTGIVGIVTPDTIVRWYRMLVAKKYDGSHARRPGRPSTKAELVALVVRMARENPTWGYTRICGGLKRLGHEVARNTIKAILKDHGIEPAPERGTKTSWKTFLAAHWDGLAAADFFTVEVLTLHGLVDLEIGAEVVGDKGYHSKQSLVDREAIGVRGYILEPDRGVRNWTKNLEP